MFFLNLSPVSWKRVSFLLNDNFATTVWNLVSRLHIASFVIRLPNSMQAYGRRLLGKPSRRCERITKLMYSVVKDCTIDLCDLNTGQERVLTNPAMKFRCP
jgi:hypothetical protein